MWRAIQMNPSRTFILQTIATLKAESPNGWIQQQQIAQRSGYSAKTVQRAVFDLQNEKLLTIKRAVKKKGFQFVIHESRD